MRKRPAGLPVPWGSWRPCRPQRPGHRGRPSPQVCGGARRGGPGGMAEGDTVCRGHQAGGEGGDVRDGSDTGLSEA